jgi:DNA-binding NarL/FixJ family response regulator
MRSAAGETNGGDFSSALGLSRRLMLSPSGFAARHNALSTVQAEMADTPSIRIVVGEDQPIVREGIVRVLEGAGFEVVGVAGDAEDLIRKAGAHKPDVVVTDIQMPPTSTDDGLEAAKKIRAAQPDVGVLVLSQYLEDRSALELLGDGAEGVGYLLKDRVGDLVVFTDAVRRVAGGGSALDPQVVERMVDRPRADSPIDELTPREREVLALMAEGRSNQAIADELVVTVAAVERHVTSIFSKLDLRQAAEDHRRVLAVLRYLRR